MIVVIAPGTAEALIKEVEQHILDWGYEVTPIYGTERTVLAAVGVPEADKAQYMDALQALDQVEQVIAILKPYKLASRDYKKASSVISVDGVPVGGNHIVLMAGPCTVETYEQTYESAKACHEAGAQILRGGAYKPCTSPYSFQGHGVEGLKILRSIADEFGMKVVTEVMDPRNVEMVCEYAHLLQIGTRNMQNYDLLREVGKVQTPVLLKRGMWAKYEEWLQAAEYVLVGGNENVILCERGVRTFETYTRNTLDLASVPVIKELSHLPIIIDPSQGTGKRSLVEAMSKASVAVGADGLIIEVHPHPDKALKDGAQSLTCQNFTDLVAQLKPIAQAVGRTI